LDSCERKICLLSISAVILIVFTFLLWCLYPELYDVEVYLNALTVVAAGAAFWASLRVLERQRWILYELLRAPWFYISVGLGLWLTAETIWLAYIVLLGEPLEFSVAGATWLLGYVFMLVGFYRGVRPLTLLTKKTSLSRRMRVAYLASLVLGVLLLTATFTRVPGAIAEEGLATVLVDTLYVVLDLALLTLSLEGAIFLYGGRLTKGPALFSLGMALLTVGDLPYFVIGGYYPGNILDLLYVVSYIVMATGIYIYSRQPPVI